MNLDDSSLFREYEYTSAGSADDALDPWFRNHYEEAARYAKALESWSTSAGFLELRLPGFVHSSEAKSRYLDMCAVWRHITNVYMRGKGFMYGGYRATEFAPVYHNTGRGDSSDLVDVFFRVVVSTRSEALRILQVWLHRTRIRVGNVEVFQRGKERYTFEDITMWGDAKVSPRRGDMWKHIEQSLRTLKHIAFRIGGQLLGGDSVAASLFCRFDSRTLVWRPPFRYKYVIPFGCYDTKYKGTTSSSAPWVLPESVASAPISIDRFERVITLESPPSVEELGQAFDSAPGWELHDSEIMFLLHCWWDDLEGQPPSWIEIRELGELIDKAIKSHRRLLRTSVVSSLGKLCGSSGVPDLFETDGRTSMFNVQHCWEYLHKHIDNCERRIKWSTTRGRLAEVNFYERDLARMRRQLAMFKLHEHTITEPQNSNTEPQK